MKSHQVFLPIVKVAVGKYKGLILQILMLPAGIRPS
jgi:hypothetical protein